MPAARLTVALTLLFIAGTASAEAGQDLTFAVPAQAGPSLASPNAAWAFISFATFAENHVDVAGEGNATTYTRMHAVGSRGEFKGTVTLFETPGAPRSLGAFNASASFAQGQGSLYVEAESIRVEVVGSQAVLDALGSKGCVLELLNHREWERHDARSDVMCPGPGPAIVGRPVNKTAMQVQITASGISRLEWHNAEVQCRQGTCPGGGARQSQPVSVPAQDLALEATDHEQVAMSGDLVGSGRAATIAFGGSSLDLDVVGAIRLPGVAANSLCGPCDEDQTLTAEGSIQLRHLNLQEDGRIESWVGGNVSFARLDEAAIDANLLRTAGWATVVVTAAVGGLLIAKALAATLFTKRTGDPLDSANRRRIHDYIEANPGASYREIIRETKLANGTTHHHLAILVRSGHLSERAHGQTRRFFTKGIGTEWQRTIMMRDEALRCLFQWVQANPRCTQGDVLEAMEAKGWHRSTTQHRLQRLCKDGHVTCRPEGRYKRYEQATIPARGANEIAVAG